MSSFDAVIGKSDMQMSGKISNYIAYALDSAQVLKGRVNFSSTLLDLDEFIPEEGETASTEVVEEDTTALSVILKNWHNKNDGHDLYQCRRRHHHQRWCGQFI